MLNKNCIEFVELLASKEPVPGGGGASAYVASIGMALGSMVGNLTLGKKKYADVQEDIEDLLEKAEKIMTKLNELISEDAKAFKPLSDAYRLPSNTAEEKSLKEKAIQDNLLGAAAVPMEIAEVCCEALKLHKEFALKGSKLAISDAGCGAAFCKSALLGARLNVLINLKLMDNEDLKKQLKEKIDSITKKGTEIADNIYEYVENHL